MQPGNPNPSQTDQYLQHLYAAQYSLYYSQNPKPNPNPNPNSSAVIDPALNPPGAEQLLSLSSYAHGYGGGYQAQQPGGVTFAHYQTVAGGSAAAPSVYLDPNGGVAGQQFGANLYVTGGTTPQNGIQQSVPAILNPTMWTNPTYRPRGPWKKVPKKTKIAQSAWCEVCKVECNTKDVLDQHKLGKKHMKNLEKLKAALVPAPVASAMPNNPVIGPQENPAKGTSVSSGKKKKKATETAEDLERKKRKVLEGGAAANAVRSCGICNVVCNSDTVFQFHLAGQKHISMMTKKHADGTGLATST